MKKNICSLALVFCAILAPIPAWADLYSANSALDKQDFARAFELYRELAEMGQPEAQENIAVMYVNGEGVKRDNVLGYAWAVIAIENGRGEAAKGIVDQLTPHMNDAARQRVAEVQSKFGKAALEESVLPVRPTSPPQAWKSECAMVAPVDPSLFYPVGARDSGISGETIIEHVVFGDGHAHDPRSLHSFPPEVFAVAGRNVALHNRLSPKRKDGVAVPCTIVVKVKFTMLNSGRKDPLKDQIDETRERAKRGDPMSQLAYAVVLDHRGDFAEPGDSSLWWYLRAAQAGIPFAQHIVGAQLLTGTPGGATSVVKGVFWLKKAATAGNPEAQLALANYYLRGDADAGALATAADLFGKAVAGGNRDAKFYFAALLATSPVPSLRDPSRALALIDDVKADYGVNPIWSEIRAAAFAQSQDFNAAQKEQGSAVRAAKKLRWNTAPQEARLAEYSAGKTWTGDLFAFY